jgi:hypothetical protein
MAVRAVQRHIPGLSGQSMQQNGRLVHLANDSGNIVRANPMDIDLRISPGGQIDEDFKASVGESNRGRQTTLDSSFQLVNHLPVFLYF